MSTSNCWTQTRWIQILKKADHLFLMTLCIIHTCITYSLIKVWSLNTFKDKYFLFILFMYIYVRERGVQAIPDINTTHNNLSCVCPPPCNPLAPPLDWPGDRHSWRYPGITPLYVPSTINLIKDSEPIAIIFINLGNLLRIDHSYLYICLLNIWNLW